MFNVSIIWKILEGGPVRDVQNHEPQWLSVNLLLQLNQLVGVGKRGGRVWGGAWYIFPYNLVTQSKFHEIW